MHKKKMTGIWMNMKISIYCPRNIIAFIAVLIVILMVASIIVIILHSHEESASGLHVQGEKNLGSNQPTKITALPDSLKFANSDLLRDRLINDGLIELDTIKSKYATDMLLGVNCDVAKSRVFQDYGKENISPLMLGASIIHLNGRKPVFAFQALNLDRETDRLLIVGRTSTGDLLRVVYHIDIEMKEPSLVVQRFRSMQKVSIDEIQRLGEVKWIKSEIQVYLPFLSYPLPIPDISPIAAAVEDRKGRSSNFVTVLEMDQTPQKIREENNNGENGKQVR
jgi:hypothetical protein